MLLRFKRFIILSFASALGIGFPAPAQDAPQSVRANVDASLPANFERRLKDVYDRVSPAIVSIEGSDGKTRTGFTGVIVSAQGHVLMPPFPADFKLMFHLSDGRTVPGTALGSSREWGVALAKLDGVGPWSHVDPLRPIQVHAGQAVVTFSYSVPEAKIALRPLLDVEHVKWCVPGQWFMTQGGSKVMWKNSGIAFDLDGRLIGIEGIGYPLEGSAYTHVRRIQAFWSDLIAGKNVDRIRLSDKQVGNEIRPPSQAGNKAKISEEAQQKAVSATVRIRRKPGADGLGGVIISADGMVATCAHHKILPGSKVTISLPDGRDVAGEVIGITFPTDIGLVRITEPGPFPYVERGDSTRLGPGDDCIAVGYGPVDAKARKPIVRKLALAAWPDGSWTHELPSDQVDWMGGDCGGGVFDASGRLVAIFLPGNTIPHGHKRIELLRAQWDDLHASFELARTAELETIQDKIQPGANHVKSCTVEILDGDKPVALGTIIGGSGRLITKASLVPRNLNCRLTNGRILPAKVLKVMREYDVAILKIDAQNLPVIQWAKSETLPVGTVVGLAAKSSVLGFISHSPLSFPAEEGGLGAQIRDTEQGVEVEELFNFFRGPPRPLRKGDIILSVEGRPTPNCKELLALFNNTQPKPLGLAGDVIHLVVRRKGEQLEFDFVLAPQTGPRLAGQSARCSGFPNVYGVAARADFSLCGGPAHDRDGRVIGIVIANRQPGWLLVIPAATAKKLVAE